MPYTLGFDMMTSFEHYNDVTGGWYRYVGKSSGYQEWLCQNVNSPCAISALLPLSSRGVLFVA